MSAAQPLPVSAPAAQGVDPRGVHGLLDALEAAPDIEPHSLMILRHDHLVAAGWWSPFTAGRPHLLYSLSKSFTSAAAGLATAEGLLDLDRTVVSYFPEFEAEITDPRSRSMLVRHIASMASGHLTDTAQAAFARDGEEPVRGFLQIPPDQEPGTVFAYNQPATYTLAAIIQRAAGRRLTRYLRPRLFDPLGIGEVSWRQDPPGRELGYTGMYATTDAIARLGLLHLRGGAWRGRRLLPAAWVAEATRPHVSTAPRGAAADMGNPDWQQGYGFQFWMARHGYRGDGAFGQFCLVLPEHDAVVAITSATERMQAVLDAVWEHLLPAFRPAPVEGSAGRDRDLPDRLSALELPPVAAEPAPAAPEDWARYRFEPRGGTCAAQPTLTSVSVIPRDGGGGTVRLRDEPPTLALPFDGKGWTVTDGPSEPVPAAVSGGWTDQDTLRLEIALLEVPHRLIVTCCLPDRTFTAEWCPVPHRPGPLRSFRAPRQEP